MSQYENDWLTIAGDRQANLKSTYSNLAELCNASGVAKAAALGVGDFLKPEAWKHCQHLLSAATYTHKHLDLTAGELGQQVGVASFEQGRLLNAIRVRVAANHLQMMAVVEQQMGWNDAILSVLKDTTHKVSWWNCLILECRVSYRPVCSTLLKQMKS